MVSVHNQVDVNLYINLDAEVHQHLLHPVRVQVDDQVGFEVQERITHQVKWQVMWQVDDQIKDLDTA